MRLKSSLLPLAIITLLTPATESQAQLYSDHARERERAVVDSIQSELLPQVCRLVEIEDCERVPVEVWTRAEMARLMMEEIGATFPHDEWLKLGRCLGEIGLVRRGVDLQEEFLALLVSQAGAGYDPSGGRYISLLDVPSGMKTGALRRMVIAHELTHAMQDREVDMEAMHLADLSNLDRYFAHRAVFEGMASVVMYSVAQDLPLDGLPDIAGFMRERFTGSRDDFGGRASDPPPLLVQFLFDPYVDGSAFVQHILAARPELSLGSLLKPMPLTEEQILHPEKYLQGDVPTPIDLSRVTDRVPAHWEPYHRNEIGEQDLRLLLTLNGSTPQEAARAASGWDGFSISAFSNQGDSIALIGVSVWDSSEDATEFAPLLERILSTLHEEDAFGVEINGAQVSFVTGFESGLIRRLLQRD